MNSDSIEQLAEVLTQSEKRYGELLVLLQREKEATVRSNAEMLAGVVEQKTEVLAVLAFLEKKRARLVQSLAGTLHIPADQLTLSGLARFLPVERSGRFKRLGVSLRSLGEKVRHANNENRMLVGHCLDLVRNTLGLFQQRMNPASVYGASGQVNRRAGSGRLLSGII